MNLTARFGRGAVALAMVLATSPAMAEGNEGSGSGRGSAEALAITADNFEPTTTLDDRLPANAPRALPPSAAMFATVSRSADGSVTQSPANETVTRSLGAGSATAPAAPKSRAGNDPALGARQVFGADDRVRISDTGQFPFRVFGYLQIEKQNGKFSGCSGTLIGPRTVLTAAHCLYDHENGWRKRFVFVPGMKVMGDAPFGAYESESASILSGYITNYQGYYGSVVPWDLGIVHLRERAGDVAGWLGIGHFPDLGPFTANIIGYPGDKPEGTMWRASCEVAGDRIGEMTIGYDCDTFPGSSGSSVYDYDPDTKSRIVLGVNVAENPVENTAVRLNGAYFEWARSLIK
ncbi:MAG: serine protease [Mesorhizobium sp.]